MLCFQNLVIKGEPGALQAFMDNLTERLDGWQRDTIREQELNGEYIAIRTPQGGELPDAMLYLYGSAEVGSYYAANIVPMERSLLIREQYDSILQAFYDQYVRENTDGYGVTAELSKEVITAADVLSEDNVELLYRFARGANMSTGSSHPFDRKRWLDFILHSFEAGQMLDSDTMVGLLMDYGWPEEKAQELASEYQFAGDLLKHRTGQEP